MYFIFPVIVIVLVIVLLQYLSYSSGQNKKVNIADMNYDYDYDKDKKQDTKLVLQTSLRSTSIIVIQLSSCTQGCMDIVHSIHIRTVSS
jgi:hypothetical protein